MVKSEFEYISRRPQKGKPQKLVFLFHGYGLNAKAMGKLADQLAQDIPDALIIMPHAPEKFERPKNDEGHALRVPQQLSEADAQKFEGRQWFAIEGQVLEDYKKPLYDLAARLNDFIDKHRDEYGLSDQDIAIMGFSQGGAVALYTAMLRDRPVACLVGHSTIFMGGDDLKSQMPTLFVYGGADEEFPESLYNDVVGRLTRYATNLEMKHFPELRHTTSDQSRKVTAAFIKKHLVPR